MPPSRTKAILKVLARGKEEKVANAVLKIFGASSIEECVATYESVGKAERASIDEMVERVAKDGSAVFWIRVESELAP